MTEEIIREVPEELVDELASSFHDGPILDNELTLLTEKVVGKVRGLKIEIFSNEHPPPHFRVIYQGETANFEIKDCKKLNGGLNKWTKNIEKWHSSNKYHLIKIWDETRPSNCTVGPYELDQGDLTEIESLVKSIDNNSPSELLHIKSKYEEATGNT